MVYNIIVTILAIAGIGFTIFFGKKQSKTSKTVKGLKEKMERTEKAYGRIGHFASQSQQICNSLKGLMKRIDETYDSGKILEGLRPIYEGMASLNGQILGIHDEYSENKNTRINSKEEKEVSSEQKTEDTAENS